MEILKKLQINTIRTKLIFAFLLVGLLPFIIFALFSYNTYTGALYKKITGYSREVVVRMQRQLDNYLIDISSLLEVKDDYYISQSIKLIQANDYYGSRKYIFRLWEKFNDLHRLKQALKEFSLTFQDGKRLSNYGLYYLDGTNLAYFLDTMENKSGNLVITTPHPNLYNEEVLSVARVLNYEDLDRRVMISAAVDLKILEDITNVKLEQGGYVFIIDKNGNIVYHPESDKIGQPSELFTAELRQGKEGNLQQDNLILTYATSKVTGWKIVSVANAGQVTSELGQLKKITFIIIATIFISIILLIIYLSAFLTRPIRELESLTKIAVNNDLNVKIEPRGNDEIADLSRSFNKMLNRIRNLVRENIAEQKQIRELEMKSLHDQIKPHFIYNTLDLIIGYLEGKPDTGKAAYLIESLGRFFRLTFAKGKEMVKISDEINHIRNYLFIQQQRFGEKFEYKIELEDDIINFEIPKLLLQPLVENAIYHGVLQEEKKGLILVNCYSKGTDIILEVIDNGIGIKESRLQKINRILRSEIQEDENNYFGLTNVNKRVKYKFGDKSGLYLESKPGIKTISRIILKGVKNE